MLVIPIGDDGDEDAANASLLAPDRLSSTLCMQLAAAGRSTSAETQTPTKDLKICSLQQMGGELGTLLTVAVCRQVSLRL